MDVIVKSKAFYSWWMIMNMMSQYKCLKVQRNTYRIISNFLQHLVTIQNNVGFVWISVHSMIFNVMIFMVIDCICYEEVVVWYQFHFITKLVTIGKCFKAYCLLASFVAITHSLNALNVFSHSCTWLPPKKAQRQRHSLNHSVGSPSMMVMSN